MKKTWRYAKCYFNHLIFINLLTHNINLTTVPVHWQRSLNDPMVGAVVRATSNVVLIHIPFLQKQKSSASHFPLTLPSKQPCTKSKLNQKFN